MTTFTNFYNLRQIEDEVLKKALANDLTINRDHIKLIDGYILIISGGTKESVRLIYLPDKVYNSFSKTEKEYYKYYYIFKENM